MTINLARDEEARLEALYSYDLLDSGRHDFCDRLTEITAFALQKPIAVISLVDRHRIWFKSAFGLDAHEIPREPAFCSEAVLSSDVYEIQDTLIHTPTCDSALVTGVLGVRFYAAAPLIDPNGYRLGTLCVLSNEPESLTDHERKILVDLSRVTMDQILLWHRSNQLRLETQRRERLESLAAKREKLEALGVMVGGVAHDLNNLLVPVLANADLLSFATTDESVKQIASEIKNAGLRGAELCNQLLTFAGGKPSYQTRCHARQCVDEGIERFAKIYGSLDLSVDEVGSLPAIVADPSQLAQILVNLLANAKESALDNRVKIQISLQEEFLDQSDLNEMILSHGAAPGRFVRFEVRDNGSGMDRNTASRAFDPFFTTKLTGNGVGLSFVVGLLKNHSAPLQMESHPGSGTSIQFWIPASEIVDKVSNASSLPDSFTPFSRVLLIDDEDSVRKPMAKLLKTQGCEVIDVASGLEGLKILTQSTEPFDLILLDLSMPGLDGVEVTATITELFSTLPRIVIITGNPSDSRVQQCIELGAVSCLQKPFDIGKLKRALASN